jgi:hypothetical protein
VVNRTKPQDQKTIGQWTWNSRLLNEKVIKGKNNECWPATNFAQTQHGPLFGVIKNGKRQMTQVCRILFRDWFNEDCEEREITHSCGDKNCINPSHWEIVNVKTHGPTPTNVPKGRLKPVKSKASRWWQQ